MLAPHVATLPFFHLTHAPTPPLTPPTPPHHHRQARGATLGDAALLLNTSLAAFTPLLSGSPAEPTTELTNGDIVSFVPLGMQTPYPGSLAHAAVDLGSADTRVTRVERPGLLPPDFNGRVVPTNVNAFSDDDERSDARMWWWGNEDQAAGGGGAWDPSESAPMPPQLLNWCICPRCLPLPGDALVCTAPTNANPPAAVPGGAAAQTPPVTGSLHRAECECLDLRRQLAAGEQLIRPTPIQQTMMADFVTPHDAGRGVARAVYATKIIVFTRDRPGMLLTVSSVVTDVVVNIIDVHSNTREVGGESAFQYKVHIDSVGMLESLRERLEQLDDVVSVLRADMGDMLHDGHDAFWENALDVEGGSPPNR